MLIGLLFSACTDHPQETNDTAKLPVPSDLPINSGSIPASTNNNSGRNESNTEESAAQINSGSSEIESITTSAAAGLEVVDSYVVEISDQVAIVGGD